MTRNQMIRQNVRRMTEKFRVRFALEDIAAQVRNGPPPTGEIVGVLVDETDGGWGIAVYNGDWQKVDFALGGPRAEAEQYVASLMERA